MTTITLTPSGRKLEVTAGTVLRDTLFAEGVEFPCGGRGRCKGCRVRVTSGALAPTAEDRRGLTPSEVDAGWRLACRHTADADLTLELAQWEMAVLSDDNRFTFTPREGFGIAVDLGTTTIAVQHLDLQTGDVLATRTAMNDQARHGTDVLSRAAYAVAGGADELAALIRRQIGAMVFEMAPANGLSRIVVAGNSVMHHLFGRIDITPLATHPFRPQIRGTLHFSGAELGWPTQAPVDVLPCIGGLVGGDVLAGIIATELGQQDGLAALVDLGTNGEIVVAGGGRLLCTSTAAGPAFEGARIAYGMRAATGAIDAVEAQDGTVTCRVIGGGVARGLCGSGLVDAVAAGLEMGAITPNGRLSQDWLLQDGVKLTPRDVRELQLAKGAIAAGLTLLTARFGATPADLSALYLAGAFGNAVSRTAAHRIGLLRLPIERILPVGNTALKGAKQALFADLAAFETMAQKIEHVALNDEPGFHDAFAEEMGF